MSIRADQTAAVLASLRELFPELCGAPIDLERHAASVIVRALNDGSASLQEGVIRYYGLDRVRRVARERTDRLTNPAYRAWRERLELPAREPDVAYAHSLWLR